MTRLIQFEADRRNGLAAPAHTEAGRVISSCNLLRHGLTTEPVILFDGARDAFERFYTELTARLKPHGPIENGSQCASSSCMMLSARLSYRERIVRTCHTSSRDGATEQTFDINLVFLRLSTSDGEELAKLSRYEAAIERSEWSGHFTGVGLALQSYNSWHSRRALASIILVSVIRPNALHPA